MDTANLPAETQTLLLKTRKDAWSSFGPKQWDIVLSALGFKVETQKEGRTITGMTFSRGDLRVEVKKEARYRTILFYTLVRELKAAGCDTVAETSKLLGLETPEREKELKKFYSRDLTNTGTCPVCRGNFKRDANGGMVHHGYTRPGDGMQHGDCWGVGFQPWELSPKGAEAYVAEVLRPYLARQQAYLARLESGEVKSLTKTTRKYIYANGRYETASTEVTAESAPYEFADMMKSEIFRTRRQVEGTQKEISAFETDIAAWKLDVLPEVKYAQSK